VPTFEAKIKIKRSENRVAKVRDEQQNKNRAFKQLGLERS
jgi:hypothetical protein